MKKIREIGLTVSLAAEIETKFVGKRVKITNPSKSVHLDIEGVCTGCLLHKGLVWSLDLEIDGQKRYGLEPVLLAESFIEGRVNGDDDYRRRVTLA